MTDCHCHILPGVDDGAKTVEESIQMLQMLAKQRVHTVWLTSHFYPYQEKIESFLAKRENAFSLLKPYAKQLDINIIPASETYLADILFSNEDISPLCINGGKYLLTELSFTSSFLQRTFDRVARLIGTYSVVPILAHIERYPKLLSNSRLLDEFIDMGCLMQINLSSLEGGFIQRKKLLKYIENNLVHIVGTDSHNLNTRPPQYTKGISIIEKKLGSQYVNQLMNNAEQITKNE